MAVNFKDAWRSYFLNYYKFWTMALLVIVVYFTISLRNDYFKTNRITMGIDDAVYVSSGVAINEKHVLTNKEAIEKKCVGIYSGLKGDIYIVDKNNLYRAVIDAVDPINNILLLRLSKNEAHLRSYAILQISQPEYSVGTRMIVPVMINKPGSFIFKKARVVDDSVGNFFILIKSIFRKDDLSGMPVFNTNFLLHGIIKENNNKYLGKAWRDEFLESIGFRKSYLVDDLDIIKKFLDSHDVEYSVIDYGNNMDNSTYRARDSVVNIICVKTY